MMIKCYMRAIRGEPLNESGARRAVSGGSGGWGAGVGGRGSALEAEWEQEEGEIRRV